MCLLSDDSAILEQEGEVSYRGVLVLCRPYRTGRESDAQCKRFVGELDLWAGEVADRSCSAFS